MGLARENWNGKYFVVQRNKIGRIVSRVKWNKINTIEFLSRRAKRTGIIRENVRLIGRTNVVEIREYGKTSIKYLDENNEVQYRTSGKTTRKPAKSDYQIWVKLTLNGKTVEARSKQKDSTYPKSEAYKEALRNALNIWYDYSDTQRQEPDRIKEAIVYYRAKV